MYVCKSADLTISRWTGLKRQDALSLITTRFPHRSDLSEASNHGDSVKWMDGWLSSRMVG